MVTGDFSLTAEAIAKEIGILSNDPENYHLNKVVSGEEISELMNRYAEDPNIDISEIESKVIDDVEELINKYPYIIFARTSPEQK